MRTLNYLTIYWHLVAFNIGSKMSMNKSAALICLSRRMNHPYCHGPMQTYNTPSNIIPEMNCHSPQLYAFNGHHAMLPHVCTSTQTLSKKCFFSDPKAPYYYHLDPGHSDCHCLTMKESFQCSLSIFCTNAKEIINDVTYMRSALERSDTVCHTINRQLFATIPHNLFTIMTLLW